VSARAGGLAALAGVAVFAAVVVTLQLLQPGYQPTHQLMSELALGPHGSAMFLAFAGIAAALAGIVTSIGPLGATRFLQACLGFAAIAFLAAGVFPLGETSEIHIAAIATAFVVAVLAIYLFPTLAGGAAAFAPRPFSWSCAAGVAVSVALGGSLLPWGIAQRLAAFFLLLWIAAVGWKVARSR